MLATPVPGRGAASPSADRPPAVLVSGLSKRFGWRWALREVDLRVERGTSLALVGPNGAGKTTLLRILSTLQRPSEGEVEVFGHPVRTEGDEIRRRAALLTPAGCLYDELTGGENLRFAAMMGGGRPDRGRILRALEGVGLEDAADVRVRGYSAGMRKRLELARLLLRRVDLLLLDEPYASLDVGGARLVDRVIARAKADGVTVVFASHQRARAVAAADRIVVLLGGRVVARGPLEEVRAELGRRGMEIVEEAN